MPITPIASNAPVRRFESGDPNSASLLNSVVQGFANQALAITVEMEAISNIQQTTATNLGQLSDAIALRNNAIALKGVLIDERAQSSASDVQASSVESGISPLNSAIVTESDRVTPVNSKLDSISPTTYQAYSATLSGIAGSAASANSYLYVAADGTISFGNPPTSSGTRMRDFVALATIAPSDAPITFPNETWTNIALVQSLNMGSDVMAWNAASQQLTLSAGEYSIEGYIMASKPQLVQMSLVQGTSARYLGSAGKGTNESGVIGSADLSIYSHLGGSFSINSSRVYVPQVFMSGGAIVPSTMGDSYPYAMLRVRHYLY